jgi:hypothetical protein
VLSPYRASHDLSSQNSSARDVVIVALRLSQLTALIIERSARTQRTSFSHAFILILVSSYSIHI